MKTINHVVNLSFQVVNEVSWFFQRQSKRTVFIQNFLKVYKSKIKQRHFFLKNVLFVKKAALKPSKPKLQWKKTSSVHMHLLLMFKRCFPKSIYEDLKTNGQKHKKDQS